jgi:hypothetical protein
MVLILQFGFYILINPERFKRDNATTRPKIEALSCLLKTVESIVNLIVLTSNFSLLPYFLTSSHTTYRATLMPTSKNNPKTLSQKHFHHLAQKLGHSTIASF